MLAGPIKKSIPELKFKKWETRNYFTVWKPSQAYFCDFPQTWLHYQLPGESASASTRTFLGFQTILVHSCSVDEYLAHEEQKLYIFPQNKGLFVLLPVCRYPKPSSFWIVPAIGQMAMFECQRKSIQVLDQLASNWLAPVYMLEKQSWLHSLLTNMTVAFLFSSIWNVLLHI